MSAINTPYSNTEEWLNAGTHALGFFAAIFGLIFLLLQVDGWYAKFVCSVYSLSMMMMFLSSTLYHGASQPHIKSKLKIVEHSAIYILIAGTYTPYMLLILGGMPGVLATTLIWFIACIGVGFKYFFNHRFPRLSLFTYLAMGWLALGFIYPLYDQLTTEGFWLLVGGGGCYTFGVLFYIAKNIPYTHAIWHLFVGAGCTCHYLSIYLNI